MRSTPRSASIRTRRRRSSDARHRRRSRALAARPRWSRSARPASTITTSTRRDRHQREAFARFIQLARRLALCRSSSTCARPTDDAVAVMRAEHASDTGGVIHCFSGDAASARRFLDLGFHISFSGIVTFKTADALREAARIVPADRLMVETDAPFLAPIPYAAAATSRRWSCRPPPSSPRCAARRWRSVASATSANRDSCSVFERARRCRRAPALSRSRQPLKAASGCAGSSHQRVSNSTAACRPCARNCRNTRRTSSWVHGLASTGCGGSS